MSDAGSDYADKMYTDIEETEKAVWNVFKRQWEDRSGNKVDAPLIDEFRGASIDQSLRKMQKLLPELETLFEAYRTQTIQTFVDSLLERVAEKATEDMVAVGRELMAAMLSESERAQKNRYSEGWSVRSKTHDLVVAALNKMVKEELDSRTYVNDLVKRVIDNAVNLEALQVEAHNLITPKLVDLVKDLRLELTAGGKGR